MVMKRILFIFIGSFTLASCSMQSKVSNYGPKNLIQNSEFAIVTPTLDSLFLCEDKVIGKYLAKLWDDGIFKPEVSPVIILLDCNSFDRIATRAINPIPIAANNQN